MYRAGIMLCCVLLGAAVVSRFPTGTQEMEERGIFMNDTQTATYLTGESCVVDFTPDQVVFNERVDWCKHMWLKESTNQLTPPKGVVAMNQDRFWHLLGTMK